MKLATVRNNDVLDGNALAMNIYERGETVDTLIETRAITHFQDASSVLLPFNRYVIVYSVDPDQQGGGPGPFRPPL